MLHIVTRLSERAIRIDRATLAVYDATFAVVVKMKSLDGATTPTADSLRVCDVTRHLVTFVLAIERVITR